ncbi:MAG: GNAT family N-acetyltransferase [Tateyamaria sp.]|uniref:GNAT family N-acetyltransferase n=1 Tax=Tateyamaria sp. TaxID=1929288 RepID=UPI0032A09BD8
MLIRPSTQNDLASVDALLMRTYPKLLKADYAASILAKALPIISRAQPKLLSCGTYYVVEEDGVILGAGGWTQDEDQHDLGHIRHVVTDDRALRRGVGRRLMKYCFKAARTAEVLKMECWATHTAVPFYKAVGFTEVGPIDVALVEGISFPSVRMLRDL